MACRFHVSLASFLLLLWIPVLLSPSRHVLRLVSGGFFYGYEAVWSTGCMRGWGGRGHLQCSRSVRGPLVEDEGPAPRESSLKSGHGSVRVFPLRSLGARQDYQHLYSGMNMSTFLAPPAGEEVLLEVGEGAMHAVDPYQ